MSRYKASLIHLSISALVLAGVLALIYFAWYPQPAFKLAGALSIVQMVIGVHLVIGPLLTLIVFKHGKAGMKFDLSIIATVQIAALAFGTWVLYDERPQYLVFAIDRVELVAGKDIDESEIRFDELKDRQFATLTRAFALAPTDPIEYQRYQESVIVEGKPDLEARPEFWQPWAAGEDFIRATVTGLRDLHTESPEDERAVQAALDKYGEAYPNLGVIPVGGTSEDIGLLIDRDSLEIIGTIDANPWAKPVTALRFE